MTNQEQEKLKLGNKFLKVIGELYEEDKFQVARVCASYPKEEGEVLFQELEKLQRRIKEHQKKFIESIAE